MTVWTPGNSGTIANGVGTATTPYPASCPSTSLIVLACASGQVGDTHTPSDAGFLQVRAPLTGNGTLSAFYKLATGSESGTFTVTSANGKQVIAQTKNFSGNESDPTAFAASILAATNNGSSSSTGIHYGATTVGQDNCLVIGLGEKFENGSGISTPGAFPNEIGHLAATTSGPVTFVWGYAIQTAAANVSAGSWTVTTGDSSTSNQGMVIVIAPASGGIVVPRTRSLLGVGS